MELLEAIRWWPLWNRLAWRDIKQRYKRTLLGPEHPECALTANNLGTVLRELGRHPEAEQQLRFALAIFEAALEPGHPHIGLCRANLAELRADFSPRSGPASAFGKIDPFPLT